MVAKGSVDFRILLYVFLVKCIEYVYVIFVLVDNMMYM